MKNFNRAYKSMAYMEMAERAERRSNNYKWIEHSEQQLVAYSYLQKELNKINKKYGQEEMLIPYLLCLFFQNYLYKKFIAYIRKNNNYYCKVLSSETEMDGINLIENKLRFLLKSLYLSVYLLNSQKHRKEKAHLELHQQKEKIILGTSYLVPLE